MFRFATLLVALVATWGTVSQAPAQEWATKMFAQTSHDFGAVARGSKAEYRFAFSNLYVEDVHVAGVRSSCGCTTPQVVTRTLKTHEKSEVIAEFNTRSFQGDKHATVTVTFDKPFFAEVQLQIKGYIRSDVVIDPGSIDLGSVDLGGTAEKKISISYAGRDTWKIRDVTSTNRFLEAELLEKNRSGGQVGYELLVRLKSGAPVGYISDQLMLVTDDQRSNQIPVDVAGRVVPEIEVSPSSLFLGVLSPGQKVTKQLIVRGRKAFRIVGVACDDDCFTFQTSDSARMAHVIPVTFVAGNKPGKVNQKIRIDTDLGDGSHSELEAYAEVIQPE